VRDDSHQRARPRRFNNHVPLLPLLPLRGHKPIEATTPIAMRTT